MTPYKFCRKCQCRYLAEGGHVHMTKAQREDLNRLHREEARLKAELDKPLPRSFWQANVNSMPVHPQVDEIEWPMHQGDTNVARYINELHEMILDMKLRIEELEEDG